MSHDLLNPVFEKEPNVELAYLYDSTAAKKEGKLSDLDIGCISPKNLTKKNVLIYGF